MSIARAHAEWHRLAEPSGPFLSIPVLTAAFPSGLLPHDPELFQRLRTGYEEWREKPQELYRPWVEFVLKEILGHPEEVLCSGQGLPPGMRITVAQHHETLVPDFALVNPAGTEEAGKPRLLVMLVSPGQDLENRIPGRPWPASPATRMMELLHGTGVPLGLVTNGEHWMFVYAPQGEPTGYANWYADLWLEEKDTLCAFRTLFGPHLLFGAAADRRLEALLRESASNQQEVTSQLGQQVRQAVEVLVRSLDRIDQSQNRELLRDIDERRLYESALTVMMRLVFLLCAEERGLFPVDDEFYKENYAVSTIRESLRKAADRGGEQILETRCDAWFRLLATFRLVYGGITHDRLNLPAYGGGLFDPDRFPWLEGRPSGTSWKTTEARPIRIDNRTVLHLLEALQVIQVPMKGGPPESQRVSFRALDIEQIGHVYEGLLDHNAVRARGPVLGLIGTQKKEPEVPLEKLEELLASGEDALIDFLHEETGRSKAALRNSSRRAEADGGFFHEGGTAGPPLYWPPPSADDDIKLRTACNNDAALHARVRVFAGLIRRDSFDRPVVIPDGSLYVTQSGDRRSTGTHYTPRSLTEPIVRHTLEPLVYHGPAEGLPEDQWKLRSAREILDLKICDMAMGSGAFLVQTCRYLSEKLVEAWETAETSPPPSGAGVPPATPSHALPLSPSLKAPLPAPQLSAEHDTSARENPSGTGLGDTSGYASGYASGTDAPRLQIRQGRHLPHWTREGDSYAVNFRLGDSLPQHVLEEWNRERQALALSVVRTGVPLGDSERRRLDRLFSEKVETYLDAGHGACWMKNPDIAGLVENALLVFHGKRYRLFAWAVMPNHVHVVFQPFAGHELSAILHSWKSFTAHKANELLGREGQFWQDEYYDHLIRDEDDFDHAVRYTLSNPAAAGLTDWHWAGVIDEQGQITRGAGVPPANHHSTRIASETDAPQLSTRLASGTDAPRLTIPYADPATGRVTERPLPADPDERLALARRFVAERCLYGVDRNPLAVEIARLSLWLVTLQKNIPFTFLDHALKTGDSLLGIHDPRQLQYFHLVPEQGERLHHDMVNRLAGALVEKVMTRTTELRRELESFVVLSSRDAERKARLLAEAERQAETLRLLGDLVVGAGLQAFRKEAGDDEEDEEDAPAASLRARHAARQKRRLAGAEAKYDDLLQEWMNADVAIALDTTFAEDVRESHLANLRAVRRDALGSPDRVPFHWALEFPEVFGGRTPGFHALVGNPPFQGGQKITGALGTDYRDYLVERLAGGQRGSADLCAYFFLRARSLMRTDGAMAGLVATNTIAQGDTREVGLDQLAAQGVTITRSVPSRKWPGTANLEVAYIWMRQGTAASPWNGPYVLDDKPVRGITPFLTIPGRATGKPCRLKANEGKSFQGSIVLGMGFVLSPEEAESLIARDPRNRDALFPYLNGEDLNSRPDQSPSRWVINFQDWPLDRSADGTWVGADDEDRKRWRREGRVPKDYPGPVAADYPDLLRIVVEKVKPERDRNNRAVYRDRWWQYAEKRPELYATIAGLERVLIRARVANINSWDFIPPTIVCSEATVIVASTSWADFALLQSTIQTAWIEMLASSMRTDVRYTPSDCFETLPFPAGFSADALFTTASRYHSVRRQLMQDRQEGLTKLYGHFHNVANQDAGIIELRRLHVEMDQAVAAAYGWTDLDLGHGFHETKQGLRYTISEPARREILDRLLELNHQRYREECAQGLHPEKKPKGSRSSHAGRSPRPKAPPPPADDLFSQETAPAPDKSKRSNLRDLLETLSAAPPAATNRADGPAIADVLDGPPASDEESLATPSSAGRTGTAERPPRPEELPVERIMAAFRMVLRGRGTLDRETLLKEASLELGYQRLGSAIEQRLRNALRAAIRRRIVAVDETDRSLISAATVTFADYQREELRQFLVNQMRPGCTYTDEQLIAALPPHLGFRRITQEMRDELTSVILGAQRMNLIFRDENGMLRRNAS